MSSPDPFLFLRVECLNTRLEPHIEQLIAELFSCKDSDPLNDQSPCNRFVGHALKLVWNLDDFQDGAQILDANHIAAFLVTHIPPWKLLGTADSQEVLNAAQQSANESLPTVAVRSASPEGHIALILPGTLSQSTTWHMAVPNSASFFHRHPEASYLGGRLSNAFSADKRSEVKIFRRLL